MKRISWDQYFMAQSHVLATRSTCTRLMVGATIVRDKRIIAGGYNGSVSGSEHCIDAGCYMIDGHCVRTVHAEANALLQCAKFGVATEDAEMYVTHFPCLQCTKQIIQAGIRKVYYASDYRNDKYAEQLFQEARLELEKVELTDLSIHLGADQTVSYIQRLLNTLENTNIERDHFETLKKEGEKIFKNQLGRLFE